jgi:tetratricopeptide (TPR) repeat protein
MMQKGPLTSIFYKPTVTIRGYYWRAGLEMFKDFPFTGVGLDRYGYYFKQYRESGYGLKYGYDITSTNAHNVPIQLFATGGIIVGLSYVALSAFVIYRALVGLKKQNGKEFLFLLTMFSGWIAYQAQSLVSIDNVGIAVWGWLLSGAVIGLSFNKNNSESQLNVKNKNYNSLNLLRPFISGSTTLLALILVIPLYNGEVNAFNQRSNFNISDANLKARFYEEAQKTLRTPLIDPNYKLITGVNLVSAGYPQEGVDVLTNLLAEDSRNLDVLLVLTQIFENSGQIDAAIKTRNNVIYLDPWNTDNYYKLGRLYKSIGDFANMEKMLVKINSYAKDDPITIAALSELTRP